MGVVENIEEIDKENEWLCKMIYLYDSSNSIWNAVFDMWWYEVKRI